MSEEGLDLRLDEWTPFVEHPAPSASPTPPASARADHKPTLTIRLLAASLVAALVAGVLATLFWSALTDPMAARETQVEHTHEVIETAGQLAAAVGDLDAYGRSFMWVHRPVDLASFGAARQRASAALDSLQALTGDNAGQQQRLAVLGQALSAKLAVMDRMIALAGQGRDDEVRALQLSGEGDALGRRLREAVAAAVGVEKQLMAEREATAARARAAVLLRLRVSCAAGLLVLVLGGIAGAASWSRRERLAREVRDAQQQVRDAAMLRLLVATSPVGMGRSREDGTVLDANPALLDILGATADELRAGQVSWRALTSPKRRAWQQHILRRMREHGRFGPFETELLLPDGQRRPVLVAVARLTADGGEFASFAVDLSETRRLQAALAETSQLLQAVFANAGDCFKVLDLHGRLLSLNGAAARKLRLQEPAEVLGRPWDGLWPEAHGPALRSAMDAARRGEAGRFTAPTTDDDGQVRWWDVVVTPLLDAEGRPWRLLAVSRDVTNLKRSETALRDAEALAQARLAELEQIYRYAPVGLFNLDRDLRYTRLNERMAAINGCAIEAHAGKTLRDVVPGLADQLTDAYRPVLERGEPVLDRPMSGQTSAAPGVERHWIDSYFPLRGPDGEVAGLIGAVLEVTESRRAEAALADSEARLQLALASAGLGAWRREVAVGASIEWDARCKALHGLPPDAVLDRATWLSSLVEADRSTTDAMLARVLDPADPCDELSLEYRVRLPDGALRWLRSAGRAYFEADPASPAGRRLLRTAGTVGDVTAQRAAEAALAESEARLRLATAAGGVGVFDWDLRTGELRWDERLRALWALAPDAPVTDETFYAGLHPEDAPRVRATIAAALDPAGGGDYEAEYRVTGLTDGVERIVATRGRVTFEGDRAVRMIGTAVDVTEQRRATAMLARNKGRLERRVAERTRVLSDAARELQAEIRRREETQAALLQSQKLEALGQLTGGVAHDFNNVLQAIQGGFQLLRRRVRDPRAEALIGHGLDAAERGARLIAQLMAFARREELQPVVTDLADVLRGTEDMVLHLAGSRMRCQFELAPDAWPVIVDPVRLETVLLNLAANARDAIAQRPAAGRSGPDGGVLTVTLRNARPEELPPSLPAGRDHVLIAVADTGAGMDAETLRRATEPFFTTKPAGKGTGLGLASAHGFAAQSSGALRLRSAPGEGTTVELFLPRADVLLAGADPREAAPADAGGTDASVLDGGRHGGATLLLVDDDDGVRPVTAGLLREFGYRVVEAPSAEAAEVLVHGEDVIDMLVTDVVMGGATGPMLAARLRAERPGLPVLYITGFAGGARLGDAPVLRKPFTDAALARAVLAGLGRLTAASAPDRLRERLRRPALRDTYDRWLALRGGPAGALPAPGAFALDDLPDEVADRAFLAEALEDGRFRYREVGRALEERLGRTLAGTAVDGAADGQGDAQHLLGGSLAAAYRRCAERGCPFYDYARFAVNERGDSLLFERLLLPLSAAAGGAVTHVAGVALFTELPAPPDAAVGHGQPTGDA